MSTHFRTFIPKFALGIALVLPGSLALAQAPPPQAAAPDPREQADVDKALATKRLANVHGAISGDTVTLTGTVPLYSDKLDAANRIKRKAGFRLIQNQITVDGPAAEDSTIRNKLAEKLTYDRVGYGTTTFNAMTIAVQNGVVTLGGVAYGPIDKDSALGLVANYPGVKDIVDNIQVAPTSQMDDRIRLAEARAIYGAQQLNRYALDPAKPIRITVINGNVTLSGVVDSQNDKDVANIRANAVPGVFKVVNNLEVSSGSPKESPTTGPASGKDSLSGKHPAQP